MHALRIAATSLGLLTLSCVAPEPHSPTASSGAPAEQERTSGPVFRMTPRQRLQALAARSRAARSSRSESETLMRTYDANGGIVGEFVHRNGTWLERPHTMPLDLARRPLHEFVSHSSGASLSGDPITDTHVGSAYDSVTSTSETITLDALADTAGGSASVGASGTTATLDYMMYGNGSAQVLSMTTVDVYFMWPGESYMQEVVFTGQQLTDAQTQFVYDTTGMGGGSLRISNRMPTVAEPGAPCGPTYDLASASLAKSCGNYLYAAAGGFLASGLFAIAGAVVPAIAPGAYHMARVSATLGTVGLAGWLVCKRLPALQAGGVFVPLYPRVVSAWVS